MLVPYLFNIFLYHVISSIIVHVFVLSVKCHMFVTALKSVVRATHISRSVINSVADEATSHEGIRICRGGEEINTCMT